MRESIRLQARLKGLRPPQGLTRRRLNSPSLTTQEKKRVVTSHIMERPIAALLGTEM
jgi:hypothetical protein